MTAIRRVRLEILRHGPSNNQLLSPLTPYLALCESYGARTVHVPWEQREVLLYGRALAYRGDAERRASDVQRLGEQLGELLDGITGLRDELGLARNHGTLVHLRLVLTANELAQVPFELALAPASFAGAGQPLLLQSSPPIVLTREVRRVPPDDFEWPREPRILFVAARSAGIPEALIDAHVLALRRAIAPWVPSWPDQDRRVARVAELLTVLPDATLRDVEAACRARAYTHVHVLAHGAVGAVGLDERFGIRLAAPGGAEPVHGDRFAEALRREGGTMPTVVTLASCDTGNVGTLLSPGASFAHALQERGVAFVVASQVPLTQSGSVVLVDTLYPRLLWGEDPRVALHEARTRLFVDRAVHDWAAVVCYAALPRSIDAQLPELRVERARRALDCATQAIGDGVDGGRTERLLQLATVFRRREEASRRLAGAIPPDGGGRRGLLAEHEGMRGTDQRWKAWVYELAARAIDDGEEPVPPGLPFPASAPELRALARVALRQASALFEGAFRGSLDAHWVGIQHILLRHVLGESVDMRVLGAVLLLVERDLECTTAGTKAWAYASCIELHVLKRVLPDLGCAWEVPAGFDATQCAHRIVELVGVGSDQAANTARHLRRYTEWWNLLDDPEWLKPVLEVLDPGGRRAR